MDLSGDLDNSSVLIEVMLKGSFLSDWFALRLTSMVLTKLVFGGYRLLLGGLLAAVVVVLAMFVLAVVSVFEWFVSSRRGPHLYEPKYRLYRGIHALGLMMVMEA